MKENLRTVKPEEFARVWEVMRETYETERHFNNLEAKYRILASQWLLGAFAAIGFVATSDPKLSFDKLWLVVAICLISMVGIFQLWRMDIIIYQRLLHATFAVGLELEEQYDFLPGIKTRMKEAVPGKSVTPILFYFYYISIASFALVGLAASLYLLSGRWMLWELVIVAVLVIVVLVALHWYMSVKSREEATNK